MELLLYKIGKRPPGDTSDAPRGCTLVHWWLGLQQKRLQRAIPLSYRRIAEETGLARTAVRDAAIWLEQHGYIRAL